MLAGVVVVGDVGGKRRKYKGTKGPALKQCGVFLEEP